MQAFRLPPGSLKARSSPLLVPGLLGQDGVPPLPGDGLGGQSQSEHRQGRGQQDRELLLF